MASAKNINLSDWVNTYMLMRMEDGYDKYASRPQVRDAAYRVLRDLGYSTQNAYSAQRIDIINNSYIPLPNAFLKETFIGVLDTNTFRVFPLAPMENINIAGDVLQDSNGDALLDAQGVELLSEIERTSTGTNNTFYDQPYLYNFYRNYSIGREYGASGGQNVYGYYRVNLEDDRIDLEVNSSLTQIVLEFITDPTMQADPKINQALEDPLHNGVYYELIKRLNNAPANEKERARREWVNSRRIGVKIMQSAMKQEYLHAGRKNITAAPRY